MQAKHAKGLGQRNSYAGLQGQGKKRNRFNNTTDSYPGSPRKYPGRSRGLTPYGKGFNPFGKAKKKAHGKPTASRKQRSR